VRSIYAGLARPALSVNFPASDSAPAMTLRVAFRAEMQGNVRANTTHCPCLTGILPRMYHALLRRRPPKRGQLVSRRLW